MVTVSWHYGATGIAIAGAEAKGIFITGLVLIFVEAFSMAVGSFLSESSAEEFLKQGKASARKPFAGGVIMFFSYFISGFIPLFPYLAMPVSSAFPVSIILSLVALFILGLIGAKISNVGLFKNGFRMLIIGGIAIGAGVIVGKFAGTLY